MKMPASKGGSSSDPLPNPGKRPVTQSLPRKRLKRPVASYSPYSDTTSLERYHQIFSCRSIITKRSVNAETLQMALLTEHLESRRWMPRSPCLDPSKKRLFTCSTRTCLTSIKKTSSFGQWFATAWFRLTP